MGKHDTFSIFLKPWCWQAFLSILKRANYVKKGIKVWPFLILFCKLKPWPLCTVQPIEAKKYTGNSFDNGSPSFGAGQKGKQHQGNQWSSSHFCQFNNIWLDLSGKQKMIAGKIHQRPFEQPWKVLWPPERSCAEGTHPRAPGSWSLAVAREPDRRHSYRVSHLLVLGPKVSSKNFPRFLCPFCVIL